MKKINNFRKIFVCLVVLCAVEGMTQAQQVPLFNQYYANRFLLYPSTAGESPDKNLSFVFRGQWNGLEGAPGSMLLAYSARPNDNENMGVGLSLQNHRIGLISQTKVSSSYAFNVIKDTHNRVYLGASPSLSFFGINEDVVSPESFEDEVLANLLGNNGALFGLNLSVSYRGENGFGVDLAIPGVVSAALSGSEYSKLNRDNFSNYLISTYYNFWIDRVNSISLKPIVTWRHREVIGGELDAILQLDYKSLLSVSAGFRNNYGATAAIGFQISSNMSFSYNHDFGKSEVPFLSYGFSEIALHINLNSKKERKELDALKGAKIMDRVRQEEIFDKRLIPEEDIRLIESYFYSLETDRKAKVRRENAKKKVDEVLDEIKGAVVARLEAERKLQIQEKELERLREQERVRKEEEQERLRELEKIEKEQERLRELERIRKEEELQAAKDKEALSNEKIEEINEVLITATKTVSFQPSSATLNAESYEILNKIAEILLGNSNLEIALEGHTDKTGNPASNLKLSKLRAESVKKYLVLKGVSTKRIAAEGYGDTLPKAPNNTPEGRSINRRVEMKIIY